MAVVLFAPHGALLLVRDVAHPRVRALLGNVGSSANWKPQFYFGDPLPPVRNTRRADTPTHFPDLKCAAQNPRAACGHICRNKLSNRARTTHDQWHAYFWATVAANVITGVPAPPAVIYDAARWGTARVAISAVARGFAWARGVVGLSAWSFFSLTCGRRRDLRNPGC